MTLPDYAVRVSKIRTLSKAVLVAQYNLVTAAQRKEWEEYSVHNYDWVNEALVVQKKDKSYRGKVIDKDDFPVSPEIFQNRIDELNLPRYIPKW